MATYPKPLRMPPIELPIDVGSILAVIVTAGVVVLLVRHVAEPLWVSIVRAITRRLR